MKPIYRISMLASLFFLVHTNLDSPTTSPNHHSINPEINLDEARKIYFDSNNYYLQKDLYGSKGKK